MILSSSISSSSSSSSLDKQSAHENENEAIPILRSLYDPPPRLLDADNNTSNGEGSSSWATEVTSGTLPANDGSSHVLYYEVHRRFLTNGNQQEQQTKTKRKRGLTALFLHGGPGAGTFPNHVRFFSPELYETVVLLDQRGCGKSTPLGEVADNTLEALVGDVERLRIHLLEEAETTAEDVTDGTGRIGRPWDVILGGSWGCTLAMAYAHTYPRHVRAMVLRGVCLFRNKEIDWLFGNPSSSSASGSMRGGNNERGGLRTSNLRSLLGGAANSAGAPTTTSTMAPQSFQNGDETNVASTREQPENTASALFAKAWEEFCKGSDIGNVKRIATQPQQQGTGNSNNPRSILHQYYHLLLGSDPMVRFKALKSWMRWEMGIYSAGFRGLEGKEKQKVQTKENSNTTVLVWNPASASWASEDARVYNNQSVVSIDEIPSEVDEESVQSLRRYSCAPSLSDPEGPAPMEKPTVDAPMSIEPVVASLSEKSIPSPKPSKSKNGASGNNSTNNNFDLTTYIPAQAMLTCYYSVNDDYCIGPYKSFLSLAPPSSLTLSSWYSSELPPTQQLPEVWAKSSSLTSNSDASSPPLPPTIAIQGGNDAICPPDTALDLHHVWKEMELRIVLEGGHSMYDSAIAGEIVKALDRFGHAMLEDTGE